MTWRCVIYHQQTTTNCWRSDYLLIIGSSVVKHTIINKVSNIILTHDISTCVVILTSHALALLCECDRFSAVGQRWLISSAMHHTHRRLMLNTPPYNSVCVCVCPSPSLSQDRGAHICSVYEESIYPVSFLVGQCLRYLSSTKSCIPLGYGQNGYVKTATNQNGYRSKVNV